MNPELKQRLIGAAVVTALATIFIPMLFDDPVDNSGQSVSDLTIPAAPIKSPEISANKLQTPASKTPKTPDAATKEPANSEEESTESVVDAEMVDDAEAEATEAPVNESTEVVADAEQSVAEEPLDTGVVEAKPPVKKPGTKPVKPVATEPVAKTNPTVKKTEANTAKPAPTKPVNPPVANVTEKPAKNPELVRWTIHAGSFGQKDNATTLMKTLRGQGIPVSIETIPSAKGPIYRLKIGPELDKKKAAANKAKLDKQGVNNVLFAE